MPATNEALSLSASWTLEETAALGDKRQGPATLTATAGLAVATHDEPVPLQYTITAAGTQTIDLRALTNPLGTGVVYDLIRGILIRVTGTGAALKVEPGASNDVAWFLRGTAPELHLDAGGAFALFFGADFTVDATHKTLLLTNTGGATATVSIVLFGGT